VIGSFLYGFTFNTLFQGRHWDKVRWWKKIERERERDRKRERRRRRRERKQRERQREERKHKEWRKGDLGSVSPTYLRTAFTNVAHKSIRIQSSCQYLFTLWGSTRVKAARRMLMKLTPGEMNICFSIQDFFSIRA